MRLSHSVATLLLCALLAGCTGHMLPATDRFIVPPPPRDSNIPDRAIAQRVEFFVDANGSFYPSGWCSYLAKPKVCAAIPIKPPKRLAGDSLYNNADARWARDGATFRALIDADQSRQLAALAEFVRGKHRVFILVHGFNNHVDTITPPFRAIEDRLDLQPEDTVIRFYWDGLTAKGLGALKIWFPAAGYSQLAGSRGLRKVLEQLDDKEVYLISHSRGASVILSALGNPVYARQFWDKTKLVAGGWKPPVDDLLNPAPLSATKSRYHLMFLAPAVGRIDFCDTSEQPRLNDRVEDTPELKRARAKTGGVDDAARAWAGCVALRSFGAHLKDIRYTINISDPALRKGVGFQYRFNPTTLGVEPEVGRALAQEGGYPMTAYFTDPPRAEHTFLEYVRDPSFYRMLCDAGILHPSLRTPARPCAPPPVDTP